MNQNTASNAQPTEAPPDLPGQLIKSNLARQVPVKLSDIELAQRGKRASDASIELQKLKTAAKEAASRAKERIDEKQTELDRLLDTLGGGFEDRIVTCQERFHAGTVLTIREDTWEVVTAATRPARPDERQIAIPGNGNLLDEAAKRQTSFPDDEEETAEKTDEPFNPPKRRSSSKKKATNGAVEPE